LAAGNSNQPFISKMRKMPEKRIQLSGGAVLVVLVCLVTYMPAFRGGFVWDDDSTLTKNIVLRENGLYQSWFAPKQPNYWPMTWTSYWLEHKFWGLNPAGYHITNILIHTACALLIWRILIQLNVPAAFAAAIIFAVHPVNVESVAWIAQRKTVLAMLFFLPALYYYLRFDQTGRRVFYALSVILFITAMLSKGSVVGLPIVILLCVWWLRGTVGKRDIFRSMPFFAVSAVMSVVELWFQYSHSIGPVEIRSDSFISRLAGAGWAVWFYLYKAVLPIHLTFIYPRWKIDPANSVSYVPGLLLVVLLAVAWRYRRGWGRPVFFALSFYIAMLFPVLGFFNIYFMRYSLVADHYQYVSIAGFIAFVLAVFCNALNRFGDIGFKIVRTTIVLLAAIFMLFSWQRCEAWRDSETLWRDTLIKNPDCAMAHHNLGLVLQSQGRLDEALDCYKKSLQLEQGSCETHNDLGCFLGEQGKYDEAIEHLRLAVKLGPYCAEVHNNLGFALLMRGRLDEAIIHFRRAVEIEPDYADARQNLASALGAKLESTLKETPEKSGQTQQIDPNNTKIR
jgi:tetratricopeptide (TPR) repeat protein